MAVYTRLVGGGDLGVGRLRPSGAVVSLLADQPGDDALAAVLAGGAVSGCERCGRVEAVSECSCCGRSLCGECSLQPAQPCHDDEGGPDVDPMDAGPTSAPR